MSKKKVKSTQKEPKNQALCVAQTVEKKTSKSQMLQDESSLPANADIAQDELKKELKKFLIPALRRASYRWKYRGEAVKKARIARGIYECNLCKCQLKNGEYFVDHINPVVPHDGWNGEDWTLYINRMFVHTDGFQVICKTCHDIKSQTENKIRKSNRES